MNKNYLIMIAGVSCLLLVGCGTTTKPTDTIDTGMLFSGEQVLTGTQSGNIFSGQSTTLREEVTGEVGKTDTINQGNLVITGKVATTTGSTSSSTSATSVSSAVKNLIQQRATQPKDDKKLTEDDIDLIDKIIQKVENMGN